MRPIKTMTGFNTLRWAMPALLGFAISLWAYGEALAQSSGRIRASDFEVRLCPTDCAAISGHGLRTGRRVFVLETRRGWARVSNYMSRSKARARYGEDVPRRPALWVPLAAFAGNSATPPPTPTQPEEPQTETAEQPAGDDPIAGEAARATETAEEQLPGNRPQRRRTTLPSFRPGAAEETEVAVLQPEPKPESEPEVKPEPQEEPAVEPEVETRPDVTETEQPPAAAEPDTEPEPAQEQAETTPEPEPTTDDTAAAPKEPETEPATPKSAAEDEPSKPEVAEAPATEEPTIEEQPSTAPETEPSVEEAKPEPKPVETAKTEGPAPVEEPVKETDTVSEETAKVTPEPTAEEKPSPGLGAPEPLVADKQADQPASEPAEQETEVANTDVKLDTIAFGERPKTLTKPLLDKRLNKLPGRRSNVPQAIVIALRHYALGLLNSGECSGILGGGIAPAPGMLYVRCTENPEFLVQFPLEEQTW